MIEPRSHLIRAGGGRVRVLRLIIDGGAAYPLTYTRQSGAPGFCRSCGCTTRYGCAGGCAWVDRDQTLCSRCLEKELT